MNNKTEQSNFFGECKRHEAEGESESVRGRERGREEETIWALPGKGYWERERGAVHGARSARTVDGDCRNGIEERGKKSTGRRKVMVGNTGGKTI